MQGEQTFSKAEFCLLPMFVSNVLVSVAVVFTYMFIYGGFWVVVEEPRSCEGEMCLRRLKYAWTTGPFLKRYGAMVNYINLGNNMPLLIYVVSNEWQSLLIYLVRADCAISSTNPVLLHQHLEIKPWQESSHHGNHQTLQKSFGFLIFFNYELVR